MKGAKLKLTICRWHHHPLIVLHILEEEQATAHDNHTQHMQSLSIAYQEISFYISLHAMYD